jgi:hypothetical protein
LPKIEDVLKIFCLPTEFERQHHIEAGPWGILADFEEIKFYTRNKSDQSTTLLIVFETRRGSGNFSGWIPSQKQAHVLAEQFGLYYQLVDRRNRERQKTRGGIGF